MSLQYANTSQRPIKVGQLQHLFKQTNWADRRGDADVATMLLRSYLCAGSWDDGRLVAFARVLSDGVFRALIEDVIVDRDYRGEGVGSRLLEFILQEVQTVEEVLLGCREDMKGFYRRFEFQEVGHPYMQLNRP